MEFSIQTQEWGFSSKQNNILEGRDESKTWAMVWEKQVIYYVEDTFHMSEYWKKKWKYSIYKTWWTKNYGKES